MTKTTVAEFLAALGPALNPSDRDVRSTTVAARIRTELTAAVKAGVFPKGTKFSVRKNAGAYYSSSAGSISVKITAWSGAVWADSYTEYVLDGERPDVRMAMSAAGHSPEMSSALASARAIAGRHNYNRSQIEYDHFDVGYYLHVDARPVEVAAIEGLRAERDRADLVA